MPRVCGHSKDLPPMLTRPESRLTVLLPHPDFALPLLFSYPSSPYTMHLPTRLAWLQIHSYPPWNSKVSRSFVFPRNAPC